MRSPGLACAELIWVHYSNPARDAKILFLQVNIAALRAGTVGFSLGFRERFLAIVGVAS